MAKNNLEKPIYHKEADKEARGLALTNAENDHKRKLAEEERAGLPTVNESMIHEYIKNRIDAKTQGGNQGYKTRKR